MICSTTLLASLLPPIICGKFTNSAISWVETAADIIIAPSQDSGVPDLGHVSFHLEVVTLLHHFAVCCCGPVASCHGILVAGIRRAVGILLETILATEVCVWVFMCW